MSRIDEALLDEHLAAENEHDLDRIMSTYGAQPSMVVNGQRIEGEPAIREFHRSFGFAGGDASFSDVHVTERTRHRAGEAIIIEQTLSGVHTGAWMRHEASGRAFEVAVCTVYLFDDDGMLAGEHVYFDRARMERQLTGGARPDFA